MQGAFRILFTIFATPPNLILISVSPDFLKAETKRKTPRKEDNL